MIGAICLVLLATSCRRLPYAPPTVKPTITPTPRSTALPPIPTSIPLGTKANPIHIIFVMPQNPASQPTVSSDATAEVTDESAPSSVASALEKGLLDTTQMTVSVEVVNSDAESLSALCASPKGKVSAAWMGGLAYAAAFAQTCGSAALELQRGSGTSASTGDQARIITGAADISTVADLAKHTFCRLGYADIFSWLLPSLMIHDAGLADTDLKTINDYTDASQMIDDLAAGKCDAIGISGAQFDALVSSSTKASLHTLQQSSLIPFEVLVMPPQLPLAQQQELTSALIAIGSGSRADTLKPLLNQNQLVAVSDGDLSGLRTFVSGAGIDLSQAGN